MPHPAVFASDVVSPYDAGLSYFQDEYSNGDGGFGDASRLGFIQMIAAVPGIVSEGQNLLSAVGIGMTDTDKQRQARANSIGALALQGSVLAAQIVDAAPNNVSGNEAGFWRTAATTIQQQRPDVWSEALAAGPWWPVGQDFNMTQARAQIAAQLASAGVTVNNAAQLFGSATGMNPGSTTVAAGATVRTGVTSLLANPLVLLIGAGGVLFLIKRPRQGR